MFEGLAGQAATGQILCLGYEQIIDITFPSCQNDKDHFKTLRETRQGKYINNIKTKRYFSLNHHIFSWTQTPPETK